MLQIRRTIAKQILARLPALRTSLNLPLPLPRLQDDVSALVATFAPRAAAPALPPDTCDLLLLAMLAGLARGKVEALQAHLCARPRCRRWQAC